MTNLGLSLSYLVVMYVYIIAHFTTQFQLARTDTPNYLLCFTPFGGTIESSTNKGDTNGKITYHLREEFRSA